MSWDFLWLRDWDDVWSCENLDPWLKAFAPGSGAVASPYMHPHVVRAWLNTHGQEAFDPFFMRARNADGMEAMHLFIRPCQPDGAIPIRVLHSVGGDQFDYTEPAFLPPVGQPNSIDHEFWPALATELRRYAGQWFDRVLLPRVRADILGPDAESGQENVAPFLRLDGYASGEAYLMSRSKVRRKGIRRAERRLQEMGELVFRVHGPDETAQVQDWVPKFVSEKARKHPSDFLQDRGTRYFHQLVQEGMPSGIVNVSSMELDGETISWEFNFLLDGILHGYSCATDYRFRNMALGALHLTKTIDWAIGQDLRAYDFLWGDEDYKYSFTDAEFVVMRAFELHSATPSSRLRRAGDTTRRGIARALVKARASVPL